VASISKSTILEEIKERSAVEAFLIDKGGRINIRDRRAE
jgi:hypothetical protein